MPMDAIVCHQKSRPTIRLELNEWNEEDLQAIEKRVGEYIKEHTNNDENNHFAVKVIAKKKDTVPITVIYEKLQGLKNSMLSCFSGSPDDGESWKIDKEINIPGLVLEKISQFSKKSSLNDIEIEPTGENKAEGVKGGKGIVYYHLIKNVPGFDLEKMTIPGRYPECVTSARLRNNDEKKPHMRTIFINKDGEFCTLGKNGSHRRLRDVIDLRNILFATFAKDRIPSFYFFSSHNPNDTARIRMHHPNNIDGPGADMVEGAVFNALNFFGSSKEGRKFIEKINDRKREFLSSLVDVDVSTAEEKFKQFVIDVAGGNKQELTKGGGFVSEVCLARSMEENSSGYKIVHHQGDFAKPLNPENIKVFIEILIASAPILVSEEKLSQGEISAIRKKALESMGSFVSENRP